MTRRRIHTHTKAADRPSPLPTTRERYGTLRIPSYPRKLGSPLDYFISMPQKDSVDKSAHPRKIAIAFKIKAYNLWNPNAAEPPRVMTNNQQRGDTSCNFVAGIANSLKPLQARMRIGTACTAKFSRYTCASCTYTGMSARDPPLIQFVGRKWPSPRADA